MITIRPASETEVATILAFIRELAEYERLAHAVTATEADLRATLFGAQRYGYALFACSDERPVAVDPGSAGDDTWGSGVGLAVR